MAKPIRFLPVVIAFEFARVNQSGNNVRGFWRREAHNEISIGAAGSDSPRTGPF